MKQILIAILILGSLQSRGQDAETPKAQFLSVITLGEVVSDYYLISNYYPLKGNINNKSSIVYVSDTPTLNEIENAAINIPSDFFFVSRNEVVHNKVMLINKPARNYYVASPQTGEQEEYECLLKGDITDNRANEIINEGYDPAASIEGGKLYFNNKVFEIIPRKEIRQDVINLISIYNLSKSPSSGVKQGDQKKE